jgi:hypothetical protein
VTNNPHSSVYRKDYMSMWIRYGSVAYQGYKLKEQFLVMSRSMLFSGRGKDT